MIEMRYFAGTYENILVIYLFSSFCFYPCFVLIDYLFIYYLINII